MTRSEAAQLGIWTSIVAEGETDAWSSIRSTSTHRISVWVRLGAIGAIGAAAVGLVDVFGAPTGAQQVAVTAKVVSIGTDGQPLAGANSAPSVANDGSVVVFTSAQPAGGGSTHDIMIRRGIGATAETLSAGAGSSVPLAGAVSGDGCRLAYSAMVPGAAEAAPVDPDLDPVDPDPDADPVDPDPADQQAGLVRQAAPSDVVELRILDICGAPGVVPSPTVLDRLAAAAPLSAPALSIDGGLIAWSTGSSVRRYDASSTPQTPVFVEVAPPAASDVVGARVDMTSDGSTVVFESAPAPGDGAARYSVYTATIPSAGAQASVQLLAPSTAGSAWPSVSANGAVVAYQSDAQLPITGVPGSGSYVVVADRTDPANVIHRVVGAIGTRPDISSDGTRVVYDVFSSVQIQRSDSAAPFASSTIEIVNPRIGVDFVEGAAASVSGPVIAGNGQVVVFDQPANVPLSSPAIAAPQVWSQDVAALLAPPPTTTTTSSTTTSSTTTTTSAPVTTTRPTTRPTTPRSTTPRTTASTVRPTTTVAETFTFEPPAFEFAPTIVDAGQRTAELVLFNDTAAAVVLADVTMQGDGAAEFLADFSTCATIPAGGRCAIAITFRPTQTGERIGQVVAMTDGTETATATVRGLGVAAPTLIVTPDVASSGQVVAIIGGGFPAGLTVEVIWHDGLVRSDVLVDAQGSFSKTLVILPNTTAGPSDVTVTGQVDLFGDVTATLLISRSSSGGSPALAGSVANDIAGR